MFKFGCGVQVWVWCTSMGVVFMFGCGVKSLAVVLEYGCGVRVSVWC